MRCLPEKPFNSKKPERDVRAPFVSLSPAELAPIDPNVVSGIFQIGPFSLSAVTKKNVNNVTLSALVMDDFSHRLLFGCIQQGNKLARKLQTTLSVQLFHCCKFLITFLGRLLVVFLLVPTRRFVAFLCIFSRTRKLLFYRKNKFITSLQEQKGAARGPRV